MSIDHKLGQITRFCVEALDINGERVSSNVINKAIEMPRLYLFGNLVKRIARVRNEKVQNKLAELVGCVSKEDYDSLPDVLSLERQSTVQIGYFSFSFNNFYEFENAIN